MDDGYVKYTQSLLREIAKAVGVPYEKLSRDRAKTNHVRTSKIHPEFCDRGRPVERAQFLDELDGEPE